MIRTVSLNLSLRFQLEFCPDAAWRRGFGGTGFSLWGLILAKPKTHRLKPVPPNATESRGQLSVYRKGCVRSGPGV
jgi:hypothetical protein